MTPDLSAGAALLMDAETGGVLWEKNGRRQVAPASTTKLMTAILAVEYAATGEGGEALGRFPLLELVERMLLSSSNGAAAAIAEGIAGSSARFVRRMNEKAAQIGAVDTHFRNPHGLDQKGHLSTPQDIALMARCALSYPLLADIVRSRERWVGGERLRNTNRLLWLYPWADGVKTGTTPHAGRCLVASATGSGERGRERLITAIFEARNRWQDSIRLLEYGFLLLGAPSLPQQQPSAHQQKPCP